MKPSPGAPRVLVASIACVLLILLLNTCGLERFIQLHPPSNPEKGGDNRVSFTKTTANSEPEFIGFDLYYKFYGLLDDPYSDLNAIVEFEDLEARGFRRIHYSTDKEGKIERPLIGIDLNDRYPEEPPPADNTNDEFTLTAYLSGAPTDELTLKEPIEYPIIIDDGTPALIDGTEPQLTGPVPILIEITDIRRDVYDSTNDSYKRFSDFSSGDADISSIWSDIELGYPIQFAVYAVSYGYDISNFRPLYSKPEILGIIERTFPLSE